MSERSKKQGLFSTILSKIIGAKEEDKKDENINYELIVITGEDAGRKFILPRTPLSIGRKLPGDTRQEDILINDTDRTISTEQARLSWSDERNIHIMHFVAGTRNPTIINGITIDRATYLIDGCKITIGKNTFIYSKIKLSVKAPEVPSKKIIEDKILLSEEEEEEYTSIFIDTDYALQILSGPEKGKNIDLNTPLYSMGKFTGKEKNGWILLDSSFISGDQATIKWKKREEKFGILHTENATNPTLVNGKKISSQNFTILSDGDIIKIGNMEILVKNKKEEKKKIHNPKTADISQRDMSVFMENRIPPADQTIAVVSHPKIDLSNNEEEDEDLTIIESTARFLLEDGARFLVIDGPDEGNVFTVSKKRIEDKLIIGARGRNRKDIELTDYNISENFASLTVEEDWLCINLEDKTDELFVNDIAINKKGLENKDIIKLGSTVIEYNACPEEIEKQSSIIEVIDGNDRGKKFLLDKKITHIGRKSRQKDSKKEIELSPKDRTVSRHHAIIEKKKGEFYIINEKPDNTTLLNGVQIMEPRPLLKGDKIQVGDDTVLLFHYIQPPFIPGIELKEKKSSFSLKNPDDNMAFIPEGFFIMGSGTAEENANPEHRVYLKDYYIDRYPVTNSQYKNFTDITGYKSEGNWQEYFTEGKELYPVVGVSWNDAMTYASRLGKSLPTEAEWEKAGRGENGQIYPGGNKWRPETLNSLEGEYNRITEVNNYYAGKSPYGVMDMAGNVWEWTGDKYLAYPYKGPCPPDSNSPAAIRGGDYMTEMEGKGVTVRKGCLPAEYKETLGFRCVRRVDDLD